MVARVHNKRKKRASNVPMLYIEYLSEAFVTIDGVVTIIT